MALSIRTQVAPAVWMKQLEDDPAVVATALEILEEADAQQ